MKSLKYLLISLILLISYESSFPKDWNELVVGDYIFLIGFTVCFWVGLFTKIEKTVNKIKD